jgi:hypothetical protein
MGIAINTPKLQFPVLAPTVLCCSDPSGDPPLKWAIAIHGGAGVSHALRSEIEADLRKEYEEALQAAVSLGGECWRGAVRPKRSFGPDLTLQAVEDATQFEYSIAVECLR